MKRIVFSLLFMGAVILCNAQQVPAQVEEGEITYKEVLKLDIKLDGADDLGELEGLIPKERVSRKILRFNESGTLYESVANEKEEVDRNDERTVVINVIEPEYKLFTDLSSKTQIEQKEFMNRRFLIEGNLPVDKWKLTGNQKQILEYPCQEALLGEGDDIIRAWFTPNIPVSSGPGKYGGLPGMILAIEEDNGMRMVCAEKIIAKEVPEKSMQKPRKGKKLSREAYDKMVEEKLKESGNSSGGGQQIVIKVQK